MKRRIPLLTVPFLALAASPALAQQDLYDNGPINGTTDAWTISFGYVVSDRTDIQKVSIMKAVDKTSPLLWKAFSFGVWEFPGDVMTSVDWSITSLANG